jgi:hypothetical protein
MVVGGVVILPSCRTWCNIIIMDNHVVNRPRCSWEWQTSGASRHAVPHI